MEFSREGYKIRKFKNQLMSNEITKFGELELWRAVKKCQNLTLKVNFLCQKSSGIPEAEIFRRKRKISAFGFGFRIWQKVKFQIFLLK